MNSTASAQRESPRIELRGITKIYPSVVANKDISFAAWPGEIHAVLGENGAGKSTLMKIVYGVVKADAGQIFWEGKPVVVANPAHARQLGIGMVFQHFSLFETLTVVENVALALPGKPALAPLAKRITEVSERYGLPIDPRRRVHSLSVGERQRVEIIRCLLAEPRLLIMDEPTSVLTPQAVRKLFDTLRQLSAEGRTILYISHKLDEIQALCTDATVLRAGVVTGHCDPRNETPQSMARMMIGNDLPHPQHGAATPGVARLELVGLSRKSPEPFGTDLIDIDLVVRAGEIVGIAGVSGNGQQELLAAISGEMRIRKRGQLRLCGAAAGRFSAARRRKLGLCFVPEERLGRGAVPDMSLAENALLTAHRRGFVKSGLIRFKAVARFAQACIEKFAVKCAGPHAEANSLSGGNLQKFIVGREILQQPQVLVVAQPTWGVDVGAAAFIRQKIVDLRNDGVAILVVSEELDELFEVSDRLAVLAKGRLSPIKPIRDTNVEEVGVWMSGMWPDAPSAVHADLAREELKHAAQA